MTPASPYINAREAAVHLRYVDTNGAPKMNAFYNWLHRRRRAGRPVPTRRRGSVLLFRVSDLDGALEVEEAAPVRRLRRAS